MGCDLSDEATEALLERLVFRNLRLVLGANPLTDEGRQRLRDTFGDRVTFDSVRDPDHWYVMAPNERLQVGFDREGNQVILAVAYDHYHCGVFDHAGYPLRHHGEFQLPEGEPQAQGMKLLESLAYQPGTVRVKNFGWPSGRGISDFGTSWLYTVNGPADEHTTAARQWLDTWLAEGCFKISWGYNDMWFDRDGRAVS